MIDIENEIYGLIAQALKEQFPGVTSTGEYVAAPSSFPHVSIVEQDNYMPTERMDSSTTERFAALMYEVNVYSNKSPGKKAECREIMSFIDKMLYARNFRRISLSPIPNLENATIYRLVARYRAETDGTKLYRR